MSFNGRGNKDWSDWIERLAQEARVLGDARMLRDEQPYTPEIGDQIIARFRELLERLGKSMAWAAKSMGIAESRLSEVANGNYKGDVEATVRKIDKWTELQVVRESAPKPAGFVKTEVAKEIYAAAKWAVRVNGISLCTGPAGTGKTMAGRAILSDFPGSIFISIRTTGQSKLAVFTQISRELKLPAVKLNCDQMFAAIDATLRDSNRLIIIDEVHKLAGRQKDEALHAIRDLHDSTGCPMLWMGMENIDTYIEGGKTEFEPLDQIASRIVMRVNLSAIARGEGRGDGGGAKLYTIKSIREFLAGQKIRVTPDAEGYLLRLALKYCGGHLRTVSRLLQIAVEVAKGEVINAQMLDDIRCKQTGRREQFEIESETGGMQAAG